MKEKICLALLLFTVLSGQWHVCWSQTESNFEITKFKLPTETSTYDILEDQFGFVWIASSSGLWRYNGSSFKNYKRDPKDTTSITDNHVRCLYEDYSGTLWIGTYGGGLHKYDRDYDRFQRYVHDGNDPESLSFNEIQTIFESSDNKFYIGTDGGGLNIMDRNTEKFQSFKHSPKDSSTISHNNVLSIEESPNGDMYIGTWYGFNIFNTKTTTFQRIYQEFDPQYHYYFSIEYFSKKLMTSGVPPSYLDENNELAPLDLPIDNISRIKRDNKNRCWITGSDGISIFNDKLELIYQIPMKRLYDGNIYGVSRVYESSQQNATWVLGGNGNFFLVEERPKIFDAFLTEGYQNGMINTDAFYWVVLGNEIEIYNKETGELEKTIGGFNGGTHITSRTRNKVWVADQKKYFEFTSSGKKLQEISHQNKTELSCITQTLSNEIWTGKILGANLYDPQSGMISRYNCDPNVPNGIGYFHRTNQIFQDHIGNVWIATDGDGLKKFIPETEEFHHFRHIIGDTTTINSNFVNEIFEDNEFNLWLGTSTGLCRLEKETNKFVQYNFDELQDKSIYSIEQDNSGNLWIGTLNGLIKLDYTNSQIRILNQQDGILSDKIGSASMKLDDGRLVFSTDNGAMVFDPGNVKPSTKKPNVFISKLWINNELIRPNSSYISKNIEVESAINMDYTDKKFEFEFEAVHYNNNQRCKYSYKLEGFDKTWIKANNTLRATYTNIPPGTYTFLVKASNEDGLWNDTATQIDVIISPPFWEILWIKVLAILLMAIVILAVIRGVIQRERDKTKFEIEKAKVRQSEEITQMKLRFFTNISHELRTPLTLITSPLDKYIRNNIVPKANVLDMMYKNSRRLLELVNQILDFRKLENKQQQLKVVQQKNLLLFQNIYSAYSYWSNEKKIHFNLDVPEENYTTYFDADVIEKIVSNLVSNAFKFTPENGEINLTVGFQNIRNHDDLVESGQLSIVIKDNGPGIPKDVQSKIFERFYQLDDSTMASYGSGIGLSLTSELVELHKGKIELDSSKGNGAKFTVAIPIGQSDYFISTQEESTIIYPEIDPKSTLILIAEDHEDIRNYLVEELSENYEVLEAEDGKIALQKAMSSIPDIIISDVMMPEINGIQLANQLKNNELTAHIPILFLSAKGSTEHKLEGLATGAEDYIQKPFNIQEIKLKIRNLLETRKVLIEKLKKENKEIEPEFTENKYLSKVNSIVQDNLDNSQFSVDLLCTELGVGRSQLYRKILALTGKSIIEYINSYRLSIALEMIKQGEYTIKEIAFKVGYNDNHYFSRSFKKEYGQSPTFYSPKKVKAT
jgi:signal transduction histidine kinase/DNA-binding response OmpR family regulator/ligand-binding sensor domain-containing protein